ncbi:hypothetical protein GQ54DRAFT_30237 [Martensiomyces pterosporus]|nr:hypothetical protein GQ54DRAFT_30237 [Martensiomyces pterosporus]
MLYTPPTTPAMLPPTASVTLFFIALGTIVIRSMEDSSSWGSKVRGCVVNAPGKSTTASEEGVRATGACCNCCCEKLEEEGEEGMETLGGLVFVVAGGAMALLPCPLLGIML